MIDFRSVWFLLLALGVILSGCASSPPRPVASTTIASGYQPAPDTEEAGLWLVMDRAERDLKTSGRLMRSFEVNEYLQQILCRLAADLCSDVRIYLVRIPSFNATMAPNGVMQVWTGLLLRTENEAQLASVLAHEIAHYRYQHSLEMFRQAKSTANVLAPFQVVTAAGGVGYVGSMTQLAAIGVLLKYSRDHEREADSGGMEMLVDAGYDPREAAKVWEGLLQEQSALDVDSPSIFLSTHPPSAERLETLSAKAKAARVPATGWEVGTKRYNRIVGPLRFELFRDELRLRRFAATQILLDRALSAGGSAAEIQYFQGELYSARGEGGDMAKAEEAYRECLKYPEAPSEAYRELAMIYMKSGRDKQAVSLFQAYLERAPDAFDRNMVKVYIERMSSGGASR